MLARIKKVWIGIEDPDPTVDRKGIKFLQDKGTEVYMFDRDLQEIIREENKEFLRQAAERSAAVAEEPPAPVLLSPLENAIEQSAVDDFSGEAMEAFQSFAKITEKLTSQPFLQRLRRMGLVQQTGNRFKPTGFGLLLLGKRPRDAMPQAALLGTIHYPNGKEEIRDFNGPQVLVPAQALQWLRDKLPNLIDRSEAIRKTVNNSLFEIVREGIVNALVHRDYDIAGAKSQLIVTPDVIEIRSPGGPVKPLTLEQLQAFNAPMLSRNPVLHYIFAQMEMAEERGLGLKSMKRRSQEAGLPLPTYSFEDPYLVLRILRAPEAATQLLPKRIRDELSEGERRGWQWLSTRGRASSADYADAQKIAGRVARRHLNHFVDLGLARKIGNGPATSYEVGARR